MMLRLEQDHKRNPPTLCLAQVDSLKRKLAKDSDLHRTDNLRVMQVRGEARLCNTKWDIEGVA